MDIIVGAVNLRDSHWSIIWGCGTFFYFSVPASLKKKQFSIVVAYVYKLDFTISGSVHI